MRHFALASLGMAMLLLGCGGTYEYDLREYQTVEDFHWNGQVRVETTSGFLPFFTQMQRVALVSEDGRELEIRHGGMPRVFLELRPTQVENEDNPASTQPCGDRRMIELQ